MIILYTAQRSPSFHSAPLSQDHKVNLSSWLWALATDTTNIYFSADYVISSTLRLKFCPISSPVHCVEKVMLKNTTTKNPIQPSQKVIPTKKTLQMELVHSSL